MLFVVPLPHTENRGERACKHRRGEPSEVKRRTMQEKTPVTTQTDKERLAELMQAMAENTKSPATFVFAEEFRDPLRVSMRRHLAHHGRRGAAEEDVDGLVLDAAMAIAGCAAAWRADGALPWIWASARLAGIASVFVDQWADPLDADRQDGAARMVGASAFAGDDRYLRDVLDDVVDTSESSLPALLAEALETVASRRDQAVLLEVEAQRQAGDPSPSHTVATSFAMRPDAVRQVAHRVRGRLRELAQTTPRFGPIATLALVGDNAGEHSRPVRTQRHPHWIRVGGAPDPVPETLESVDLAISA